MSRLIDFDIDTYLNPFIPSSRVQRLPRPFARALGYHGDGYRAAPNVAVWCWSFIGGFVGIALVASVYRYSPSIQSHDPPVIIGSFGAAAILEYNSIDSPLAQPRNMLFGQFLSSIVGVGITRLFLHLPAERFDELRWLAGALCVATASFVMGATKTVHPPAGATAVLAATNPQITALGWWLVPLVLLGDILMLTTACLLNNIQRQFPLYWWTPTNLSTLRLEKKASDAERASESSASEAKQPFESTPEIRVQASSGHAEIRIKHSEIVVPQGMLLDSWERDVLEILRGRLVERP